MSDDLTLPDTFNTPSDQTPPNTPADPPATDHLSQMAEDKAELPELPHRHHQHALPDEAKVVLAEEAAAEVAAESNTTSNSQSADADAAQATATPNTSPMFNDAYNQAMHGDGDVSPPAMHTKRAMAAAVMTLVVLAGLSAVWFHFNPSTYTLGDPVKKVVVVTNPTPTNQPAALGATNVDQTLTFSFNNLPALSQGHYQAWINHNNTVVSVGAFKVVDNAAQNLDGSAFTPTVTISDDDPISVTIEAGNDVATTPSKTVILSGKVNGQGQTTLAFTAIDLSKAAGTYVLATPTSPDADAKSGLWFAKTDGQTLTGPGLDLVDAPEGWKYEGQIIYKGVAVEIGRFTKANAADEFNKFTPNPGQTPAFPGEDFLQKAPSALGLSFPTDLTTGEWQVVISLEPDTNGEDPTGDDMFTIQPLKAAIAQGSQTHKEYSLNLNLESLPTGTASFK